MRPEAERRRMQLCSRSRAALHQAAQAGLQADQGGGLAEEKLGVSERSGISQQCSCVIKKTKHILG